MQKLNLDDTKGLFFGVAYGLVAYAIFSLESYWRIFDSGGLMSFSFLFLAPLVIGFITAYYNRQVVRATRIVAITMPLLAVFGLIFVSVLLGLEGIICALMTVPIFAIMSLIGSFIGIKVFERKPTKITISLILIAPLLFAPIEQYIGLSEQVFTENTSVEISASDELIWKHVTRVEVITEEENRTSLFQIMGFPRPIEATLDTIAVGGVRTAYFDRGLFFTETVTEMEEKKSLAFSIEADPNAIPPTALDEHVLVGGSYFDILSGRYELEQLSQDHYLLKLSSQFRLSTSFNFYSGFWSKLIMRDIQNNILRIVKERAEKEKK